MVSDLEVGSEAAIRLADLRKRLGRSQAAVAAAIGTTQSGVSRIERQEDLRVSTLRQYVEALGGHLRLLVDFEHKHFELSFGVPSPEHDGTGHRSFRVIWQDVATRALLHVGWLEFTGSEFAFVYTDEAHNFDRFEPFPSFPRLDETYRSSELFPFFALRLVSAADPAYDDVLGAVGLTRENATPAELLARSPGSAHDTIQVVPEPTETDDGQLVRTFLVSGVRHADAVSGGAVTSLLGRLEPGTGVELAPEPDNTYNPRALQVEYRGTVLGWMPDYLVEEVHGFRSAGRDVVVTVERTSGADVPWHLRLQCRMAIAGPR